MQKFPMTVEGAETLRNEIHDLKTVQRPQVIAAIAEAREHGDLKENAEYHAAREQQGFIEARLADYEARLSNAQIIDVKAIAPTGKVIFGTTITLLNLDSDKEVTYKIVGEHEANVKQGMISLTSPIARA
ncbi:MAG: transcription elongation factor GreA, partial [Wohlfahrtiimonas sp.]